MKDRYEKMYNIKIYKKPKPKHDQYIDNIKFIHHYIENGNKYIFKEGDYIIVKFGRAIKLLHIAKYHYSTAKMSFRHYIDPLVVLYNHNFSVFDPDTNKFIYLGRGSFAKCKVGIGIPHYDKILQIIPKEKANSNSIKLFFKLYLLFK